MIRLVFIFILFFNLIGHSDTLHKKRIFILHSYSQEYAWTKLQHDNFVHSLQLLYPSAYDISVEYLDTKRLTFSDDYQAFFFAYLQKKYSDYTPDIIYVTDDNALKFFIHHRTELFSKTPIFFSGINNLSWAGTLDKSKYTGVYETKEIVPNIELIRQFSPQTREIWIVGDASNTYHAIEADIRNHIRLYPKYTFHFLSSTRMEDIMAKLPKTPKTFVLLTTIGELRDSNGRNLTLKESIQILKQNRNLILCSMEDAYVQVGSIGGFVTSGANQGSMSAKLATRYLNGESLIHIPSIVKSPNVYMFDRKGLMESRLILSEYIARDAVILHEKRTFFERYQQSILNTVFIIVVFFLLLAVIGILLLLQKNTQLKKMESDLEESYKELRIIKEKIALAEQYDE